MKRSLNALSGYTIETTDGLKGRTKDFLFDEKRWIVRYIEADFGSLFASNKVLIPKAFLETPQWQENHFPIDISKADIEKCPALSDHLTVSRKYEEELSKHYELKPYWLNLHMGPMGSYYPPRPIEVPAKSVDEEELETILRSFMEIGGYQIHARDGNLGHIKDLIIDDEDWQIVYAVADTSNWLPWSKKVLIAIDWMKKISYVSKEVTINLSTDSIKNAPEFNSEKPIDESYEKALFNFYSAHEQG